MERDWLRLIDRRAALREQFPSYQKVAHERPGCAEDRARQEFYRAENRLSIRAEEDRRWAASVEENARRVEREQVRRANAAYNAVRRSKETAA